MMPVWSRPFQPFHSNPSGLQASERPPSVPEVIPAEEKAALMNGLTSVRTRMSHQDWENIKLFYDVLVRAETIPFHWADGGVFVRERLLLQQMETDDRAAAVVRLVDDAKLYTNAQKNTPTESGRGRLRGFPHGRAGAGVASPTFLGWQSCQHLERHRNSHFAMVPCDGRIRPLSPLERCELGPGSFSLSDLDCCAWNPNEQRQPAPH